MMASRGLETDEYITLTVRAKREKQSLLTRKKSRIQTACYTENFPIEEPSNTASPGHT